MKSNPVNQFSAIGLRITRLKELVLFAAVVGFCVQTGVADTTALLINRGLPTSGINDDTLSEDGLSTPRSNYAVGDGFEYEVVADDFTLPGTSASTFNVTDIRVWILGGDVNSSSDPFTSDLSLRLGENSDNTVCNVVSSGPAISRTYYAGGLNYQSVAYPGNTITNNRIYQLDFAVNLILQGGSNYYFGVEDDGNTTNFGPGTPAMLVSNAAASGWTAQAGADNLLQEIFTSDGTLDDPTDTGPNGGGLVAPYTDDNGNMPYAKSTDMNVQVFASLHTLPGDANMDGKVDINDLTVVLANYGAAGAAWADGDFDGDGKVDINDLTIVLANYNQSVGAAAAMAAVPEPASLLLVAAGVLGLLVYAWRKRK